MPGPSRRPPLLTLQRTEIRAPPKQHAPIDLTHPNPPAKPLRPNSRRFGPRPPRTPPRQHDPPPAPEHHVPPPAPPTVTPFPQSPASPRELPPQSPINPSDVNTVQGKYPIAPPLPGGVPGHEGVAEVVAVGEQVGHARVWCACGCVRVCAEQVEHSLKSAAYVVKEEKASCLGNMTVGERLGVCECCVRGCDSTKCVHALDDERVEVKGSRCELCPRCRGQGHGAGNSQHPGSAVGPATEQVLFRWVGSCACRMHRAVLLLHIQATPPPPPPPPPLHAAHRCRTRACVAVHVRAPRGVQVSGLSPGDWVVPMAPALGTWRTRGVYDASQWHRVPKEIGLAAAATIVIKCVPYTRAA